jgi:hypothetical protein
LPAFGTSYEQDGKAAPTGRKPKTGVSIQAGTPNVFIAGRGASSAFRIAYRGESGQRNNLRGPGYFGVDMSLAKWKLAEPQGLRFTWDVFNLTVASEPQGDGASTSTRWRGPRLDSKV